MKLKIGEVEVVMFPRSGETVAFQDPEADAWGRNATFVPRTIEVSRRRGRIEISVYSRRAGWMPPIMLFISREIARALAEMLLKVLDMQEEIDG